jgi:hypothetical protein
LVNFGGWVPRLPPEELPPVVPEPAWPPPVRTQAQNLSLPGTQITAPVAASNNGIIEQWSEEYQHFFRQRWNPVTCKLHLNLTDTNTDRAEIADWEFLEWTPVGVERSAGTSPSPYGSSHASLVTGDSFSQSLYGASGVGHGQTPVLYNASLTSQRVDTANHPSPWYSQYPSSQSQPTRSPSNMPRGVGEAIIGTYSGSSNLHYGQLDSTYLVRGRDLFTEGKVFAVIINEIPGSAPIGVD